MATHLASVGRIMAMKADNLHVRVTGHFGAEGSAMKGDRKALVHSYSVEVNMDTDEPPERVAEFVRRSEEECFTIVALRNPIPVTLTASVNGSPFALKMFG